MKINTNYLINYFCTFKFSTPALHQNKISKQKKFDFSNSNSNKRDISENFYDIRN
jgi:hypothetical protein